MLNGEISMGPGVVLRSLPRLLEHLGIPGLDEEGVRSWCRSLGVPVVTISGTGFVNVYQLQIAMSAATRIGAEDFNLDKGETPSEATREDIARVVVQLMEWRKASYNETHKALVKAGRDVADRLEAAGAMSILKQNCGGRWTKKGRDLLERHRKEIDRVEKEWSSDAESRWIQPGGSVCHPGP